MEGFLKKYGERTAREYGARLKRLQKALTEEGMKTPEKVIQYIEQGIPENSREGFFSTMRSYAEYKNWDGVEQYGNMVRKWKQH